MRTRRHRRDCGGMTRHSVKPRPEQQLIAVKPITIAAAGRAIELRVKVTAPRTGESLPVIVFSHGNAWSMDAYGPLADRWAAAGFVVVQPTHLDWRRNGTGFDDPRFNTIWRVRIADLHAAIDNLSHILDMAGGLDDRIDHHHVAVVGHSWGGQSAGALLGARVLDADDVPGEDLSHPGVSAGALIGVTGAGDTLTPFAAEHLPFMKPDYSTMTTPTLVVAGGRDQSAMSTRGPDWFTDAYHLSPAPKDLLTIAHAEHTFGGIAGEAVAETTDDDPSMAAFVADAVGAYLLHSFELDHTSWTDVRGAAARGVSPYTIVHK
jgi:dienelactone hydrolase